MTVLLAPTASAPAKPLGGRTFRKQVLKAGDLDYEAGGQKRRLSFDSQYFADLATAFKDRAFDSVKAIMAPDNNAHTMDPERMRGDVVDLVPSEDGSGLDAIMTLSEETARLVEAHPDLGVSARIVEGRTRGDGKSWPRAIQHVLLTLDPRVTGLAPWRAVNLAHEQGHEVIDLSTATTTGGGGMQLSDDDMARLAKMVAAQMGGNPGTGPTNDDGAGDLDLFADDVDDASLEAFLEGLDDDGDGGSYADADLDGAGEPVGAELSQQYDSPQLVELANTNAVLSEEVSGMRAELSTARWERERDALLSQGVPPALLDLAAPVLEAEHQGAVLDLSNRVTGQTVSPAGVIRELLRNAAGYVDLSRPAGHGAPATPTGGDTEGMHQVWETTYGKGN